jgi:hypothetical protein
MKEESLAERYCGYPSRNSALPPEVQLRFAAKRQVVRVPEAIERGYTPKVKRCAGESLQTE